MILIIIRTCKRDDALALRCYMSFKKLNIKAKYLFFAEEGEYTYITQTTEEIVYHKYCDNYGGRDNVRQYLNELNKINFDNYSKVIISDSDIIVHKDPLEIYCEYGGIQDSKNLFHFSGQFLIIDESVLNTILAFENYEILYQYFIDNDISIADDTVFGYVASGCTTKIYNYEDQDYWTHTKN